MKNQETKHRKQNSATEKYIGLLGCCLPIYRYFFAKELPHILFRIIVIILFAFLLIKIGFFIKQLRDISLKYKIQKHNLLIQAKGDEEFKKDYPIKREELEQKFDKIFRFTLNTGLKKGCVLLTVIIAACALNPNNVSAFWNDMFHTKDDNISEDTKSITGDIEHLDKEENIKRDTEAKSNTMIQRELKPINYNFILMEPNKIPELDIEIKNCIYFNVGESQIDLEKSISDYVEKTFGSIEIQVDWREIKDRKGNSFYTYTALEDDFKSRADQFRRIYYLDEWYQAAPDSGELESYINGRIQLNSVEIDGIKECSELWWKLANDYQYYAQEYEIQTSNYEAVLYYYNMSIYCCMEALKFNLDKEQYDTIYGYMIMRYRDIAHIEISVLKKKTSRAEKIGDFFENLK